MQELLGLVNFAGLFTISGEILDIIIRVAVVLIATAIIAKIVGVVLKKSFRKMGADLKIDETHFRIIGRLIIFAIYFFGILIAVSTIPQFSSLGVSIFASAGVVAIVVGFAAQQTFANIIGGIFIAIFKPFVVGDRIGIKEHQGTVEDITLRHTVIKTDKNTLLIIPNSKINEDYIINYSTKRPEVVGTLEIGISYDSSIDKARKIMIEETLKHPSLPKKVDCEDTEFLSNDEQCRVRLAELTDSAQKLRLYYWAPNETISLNMKFDLLEAIKRRFDSEGIEIPYTYITVVQKENPQLKGRGKK